MVDFILIFFLTVMIMVPVLGQQSTGEWLKKGIDLYNQGDYDGAILCYDEAIILNSSLIDAWYNKGIALAHQSKYDEAIKAYNRIIELDPNNADALIKKAEALKALRNTSNSTSSFARSEEPKFNKKSQNSNNTNLSGSPDISNVPPSLDELISDKTSPQEAGSIIVWNAIARDQDGDRVLYRYFLNDRPINDWGEDSTWTWATTSSDFGSNRIEVQVRDGMHAGLNGSDDIKSKEFTINPSTSTIKPDINGMIIINLDARNENQSGSPIPNTKIIGYDGKINRFNEIADSNGNVILKGYPGTWSFTASAEGFITNNWSQVITDNCTKHIFLEKDRAFQYPALSSLKGVDTTSAKVYLTLYLHEGSSDGPILAGAQVTIQDGSGNIFHETSDNSGIIAAKGYPGNWSFTASADDFKPISWSQPIMDTCTRHVSLKKMQGESSDNPNVIQLSGTNPSMLNSIWKVKNQNDNEWALKGAGNMGRGGPKVDLYHGG